MLKGIIVDNTGVVAGDMKDKLKRRFVGIDFVVRDSGDSTINMVDTRHADMVFFLQDQPSLSHATVHAEQFIKKMLEANKKAITLRIDNNIRYLNKDRVLFLEVLGKNSYVVTAKKKYRLNRQNLSGVLEDINDPYFVRCHKSYAVNVRNIEDIRKVRRGMWKPVFRQKQDTDCLISERYYDEVLHLYEELLGQIETESSK